MGNIGGIAGRSFSTGIPILDMGIATPIAALGLGLAGRRIRGFILRRRFLAE
jgi:hypothetical protein